MDADKLNIVGVDSDMSIYELTELFYQYYRYHNVGMFLDYNEVASYNSAMNVINFESKTISRFEAFRRIEATRLGKRPFSADDDIAAHRPNVSFGYLDWIIKYLVLPYKAMLTESDVARIRINRKLYDVKHLTETQLQQQRLLAANNPNIFTNKEIGDDVSDAFVDVLRNSKCFGEALDQLPRRVVRDGVSAFLHSDVSWTSEIIDALDLVTEPQASWDPCNWNVFFVIKKLSAAEAIRHIRDETEFWNIDALKWSLENAIDNRGVLDGSAHYNFYSTRDQVRDENYMIRSYYQDKARRVSNVGSYYGNMLVAEAYYVNKEGKINKAIFFPSSDYVNVTAEDRTMRQQIIEEAATKTELSEENKDWFNGDVLFFREDVFDSMEDAITVIPFDRAEPSLERQRGYCHELFAPLESVARLDSSILNFAMLMGVPFTKNRAQGTDAQDIEDLEVNTQGDTVDLGDREFVTLPYAADLNSMIAVRATLLQHAASKAFLGGLDNEEMKSNGRGAQLANLRLIRDARVHKHTTEDFAKGIRDLYTKTFMKIIDLDKAELNDDPLIKQRFFGVLLDLDGYDPNIFKYSKQDIIKDTGLPYWFSMDILRSGASHFGAAEVVLYTELKNLTGDILDQSALQRLTRMIFKSLVGSEDAMDILGSPKDELVTNQDQLYRARMENAAIMGSVDGDAISFEEVMVLTDKDDHVLHLSQIHNPKANQIIQALEESNVGPSELQAMTEEVLVNRTNLILKLAALATHITPHQEALDLFGQGREDINRLKEETNIILQTSEALLNNLQITLRALDAKRQDKELRLQGLDPENVEANNKRDIELAKLQAQRESDREKLMLANKLAGLKQQQHIDKQVSKRMDREEKRRQSIVDATLRQEEIITKATDVAGKNFERSAKALTNNSERGRPR